MEICLVSYQLLGSQLFFCMVWNEFLQLRLISHTLKKIELLKIPVDIMLSIATEIVQPLYVFTRVKILENSRVFSWFIEPKQCPGVFIGLKFQPDVKMMKTTVKGDKIWFSCENGWISMSAQPVYYG